MPEKKKKESNDGENCWCLSTNQSNVPNCTNSHRNLHCDTLC